MDTPSLAIVFQLAVAGTANCVGSAVTHPLDLVKCRLQYSRDPPVPWGWLRVAGTIAREEGFVGLYRGLPASFLREFTYSGLRVGLYGPIRDAFASSSYNPHFQGASGTSFHIKLAAGLASGCFAACVTNPADVIKVRAMVAHAQGRRGVRIASEISALLKEGRGILGLWRPGLVPNVQRAALVTAAQVGTYDEAKARIKSTGLLGRGTDEGPLLHAAASLCAALAAAVVTTPVDTLKTRAMAAPRIGPVDGDPMARRPVAAGGETLRRGWGGTGTAAELMRIARAEGGAAALYRGFWPTWARLTLHTVVTFTVYEQLRRAAGMRPL